MELKSLFLGLVFTIGIFALKNGIGLYYFLSQKRKLKTRLLFVFFYCIVYLLIFILSSHILQKINIVHYFELVQNLLKTGMFIHILMAGGLIIWGIVLLKTEKGQNRRSFGWLALIIPCPVCITVIFFSTAFLISYFPDFECMAVLGAYLGFMVIAIITLISMTLLGTRTDSTPESILGAAMLIIAAYFFLSVILMPQMGDMDEIYRLAAYRGKKQVVVLQDALFLYFTMAALFTTGFLAMRRKIRKKKE